MHLLQDTKNNFYLFCLVLMVCDCFQNFHCDQMSLILSPQHAMAVAQTAQNQQTEQKLLQT